MLFSGYYFKNPSKLISFTRNCKKVPHKSFETDSDPIERKLKLHRKEKFNLLTAVKRGAKNTSGNILE